MTEWKPSRQGWTPSIPGCVCDWSAPDDHTWTRKPDAKCPLHREQPKERYGAS